MPYVDIEGRKIFYVKRDGKGEPKQPYTLLLAHGLGSTHAFYEPIIPRLVHLGYTCIALDYAGSGLSDKAPVDHGIQGIVADIRRLLVKVADGTDIGSVVCVGHSMGGLVVSNLAAELQLAGVVLVGPVNPSEAVSKAFAQRIETVKQGSMEAMADTIPAAATGSQATATHRAFIRALLLSQSEGGYIALCEAIAGAKEPSYGKIKCPILAVAGEDDQTAKLEVVQKIIDSCSNAQRKALKTLPGVGHWHCIEAPDAVAAAVEQFCKGLQES